MTEPFLHDFDIHAPLHAVCSERMPQHVQGERERKFLLYLHDFLLNGGERHMSLFGIFGKMWCSIAPKMSL